MVVCIRCLVFAIVSCGFVCGFWAFLVVCFGASSLRFCCLCIWVSYLVSGLVILWFTL